MKLYVLSEHYGWGEEPYFEAAVLLVTDSRPQAEELAQQRIERPFDDDPPPSTWFLELTEMEAGVPLTGRAAGRVQQARRARGPSREPRSEPAALYGYVNVRRPRGGGRSRLEEPGLHRSGFSSCGHSRIEHRIRTIEDSEPTRQREELE